MYLHIGNGHIVLRKEVLAILDKKTSMASSDTRAYIEHYKKNNELININSCGKEVSSYIVTIKENGDIVIYSTSLKSSTLMKRMNSVISSEWM